MTICKATNILDYVIFHYFPQGKDTMRSGHESVFCISICHVTNRVHLSIGNNYIFGWWAKMGFYNTFDFCSHKRS